ncbi:serine/threonine-protein phosphatase 6 regulatory ankyrin repeat subunit A isoform X1 [Stigmatopora argus]
MRSERASRVCIVVLEEVEEDEPSFSPPPPRPKSTPDGRSCHGPRRAAALEDKPSLLRAIFNVDPDEVRSLIFKKEDVNIQDTEKRTPLHAAAYLGDTEIIELLILSGARVNAKDNKWLTPLHRAVASCSEDAVSVLLKHSADVNARDKNWQTPLHVAASNKAVRCAEALVPLLSNVNVSDRAGRTALHHAAFSGHVEMVKLLLSRGANINAFDKKDRRAIHWAAYMGHLEVVKLLVSSGAEVDCKDKKAYTPLHAAASSGMSSTVHYLLGLGVQVNVVNAYGNTPLHLACYNGQDVVVGELIKAGACVNQVNERGFSALHFASSSRQGALCQELLLAHGAHINMRSKDGKTPLHMAATHGRFSCSQALIQNGAEIDCVDGDRNAGLHVAARHGHELIVTALVKHRACVAKRGIHGMFPLHLAALSGFPDCCRKLLSSGLSTQTLVLLLSREDIDYSICVSAFDIDTPDDYGRTCLHAAAAGGNLECLNLLLNIGADFNKKDNYGRTPLHYASANCNYHCVFALVGSGAGVNELDQRGCGPLHYAAAADTDGKCVEYLLRNNAEPGVRDQHGYSAVHYASAYGRTLSLELMASETPLDVLMESSGTEFQNDAECQGQISPLHLAAYHGHCGALEVLLSSMTDVDVRNPQGRTPLNLACSRGHQECVSLLLHRGASPTACDYSQKTTPLHAAVTNGHSSCLRLLVSNNDQHVNLDALDVHKQTPLMLAVLNGHSECAYSLLSQGADVHLQDCRGRTALHRGAVTGQHECVEALLQRGASACVKDARGLSPLHLAAACGRAGVLATMLQSPGAVHSLPELADNKGYTPLHWACYSGCDACVELLLEEEVLRKIKGNTFGPLHCAVMNDNEGVAEMLIESLGANIIDSIDSKGRSPLHAAAFADRVECISLLLSQGAHANIADTHARRTPLMMAALNGQTNAVEALVSSSKADFALQDADRNTALHLACSKGHETCALLILEKIRDKNLINCTNAALRTPLHVAAKNGLTVVVQELLGKGASVQAVDENGYTPALACAPSRDVADCLALILNSMMPASPMVTIATLPEFSLPPAVIKRHPVSNHVAKGVAFESPPPLRPDRASHCRPERPPSGLTTDEELNDSDSETY